MRKMLTALLPLLLAAASPVQAQEPDTAALRTELVRARGMIRAAETQILKTEGLLAGLRLPGAAIVRDTVFLVDTVYVTGPAPTPEPEPPPPVVEEPPPVAAEGDFVVFPSAEVEAILGPQLVAGSEANPWPWFDQNAAAHADKLWGADGAGLKERSNGYYYDAALVQYLHYYRTGDGVALARARELADHWYDTSLLSKERYDGFAPREMALSGLILRAMDGRPEMWDYILSHGDKQLRDWLERRLDYPALHFGVRDGGYMLIFAEQIARTHPDPAVRAAWAARATEVATRYFVRLQSADGGWYWKDTGSEQHPGGVWAQPFMVGLLLEGLILTHQRTGIDAVRESILRAVDWLRGAYRKDARVPETRGRGAAWRAVPYFVYTDGGYNAEQKLAGEVRDAEGKVTKEGWDTNTIREGRQRNSLVVHAFGYAYHLTGDAKYRQWGDEIFAATYGGPPPGANFQQVQQGQGPGTDGMYGLADFRGKEYNQAYRSAGRYLAWRLR